MITMPVREFLVKCEEDVDMYTDVVEREVIAYCPVTTLTEEGEKEWADVLDLPVEVDYKYNCATVVCETEELDERAWEFFASVAGYCSDSNWEKWFEDGE